MFLSIKINSSNLYFALVGLTIPANRLCCCVQTCALQKHQQTVVSILICVRSPNYQYLFHLTKLMNIYTLPAIYIIQFLQYSNAGTPSYSCCYSFAVALCLQVRHNSNVLCITEPQQLQKKYMSELKIINPSQTKPSTRWHQQALICRPVSISIACVLMHHQIIFDLHLFQVSAVAPVLVFRWGRALQRYNRLRCSYIYIAVYNFNPKF